MRRPKTKLPEASAGSPTLTKEQKRDITKVDKTILDNFYKLVNSEGHVRLTAAMSTFKILVAMKKRTPEKFNEHLNYCVERLVTGLASPRALARRGYATLLLEILRYYQFSTEKLLSIAQKKFGNIQQESKDNLVGHYLLITIILESANYKWKTNKDSEFVEKMYKLLVQLRHRKSYFDVPVNKLLIRYYVVFQPYMQSDNILDRLADPPVSTLGKSGHGKLTEGLFNDCAPDTLEAYIGKLMETFDRKHGPDGKKLYPSCAKQMAHVIRRPQMINKHECVTKLAKFLIANGLFVSVESSKLNKSTLTNHGVVISADPLNNATRTALKTAYHATLDHIVSTCDAQDRLKLLLQLIHFTDELIAPGAVAFIEHVGNITQQWKAYMKCLSSHTSLVEKKADPKILYPITSLYLFYGFQILEHNLGCEEQLNELAQSAKDALRDDPNDGTWADVLTDQLIAILSATECNPWIRRLCVSIFGSLLPHISEASIDLLCDVFKMPDEEEDEEVSEGDEDVEMEEDDDDGANGDSTNSNEATDEGVSDGESSNDDDDEDEDDDVSNDEDRMSMRDDDGAPDDAPDDKVNGQDEEEEEYLDDEQMMKLDGVLAEMFKLNRVGKKNKKDTSFQLRCLDLVKKVLQKKQSDHELIKKILATIVPFATKCRRHKETRTLAEKITKMIAKIRKLAKAPIAEMN